MECKGWSDEQNIPDDDNGPLVEIPKVLSPAVPLAIGVRVPESTKFDVSEHLKGVLVFRFDVMPSPAVIFSVV